MKKIFALLLASAGLPACAQHLPNSEFDNWKSECGTTTSWAKPLFGSMKEEETQRPGVEPADWNGSNIKQTYAVTISNASLVTKADGATDGSTAVKLVNILPSQLSELRAPGFLTLAKPWVYPHSASDQADGGVYGSAAFSNKPDAIKVLVRQVQQYKENAHIIAYIWAGTFKSKIGDAKSPSKEVEDADRVVMGRAEGTQSGTLIASCDYEFSSYDLDSHTMDWTEITVPLTYTEEGKSLTPEKVNVIFSAADYWTRSNIKEGNELYVDRADFVYYHALSALSYDGKAVSGFAEGTLSYDLSSETYDASKLSYEIKGVAATAETSYDEATGVLTITVKGNDYAADNTSATTYTVQFATGSTPDPKPDPQPEPQPEPEPEPDYDSYYTLNYDKDTKQEYDKGGYKRYTNTVTFTTPTDGVQSFDTKQSTDKLLYVDQADKAFKAKAGETLAVSSDFNGSWMHSYLYIDFGNDGAFSFDVNADGTPADGSDIFSYSYYDGKNSKSEEADAGGSITPPEAAVPANVATGFYRVRYKIDWDNLDAGGSKEQSPADNGGIIFDTRVNIHADEVSVSATGENGSVTNAAGATLDGTKTSFGSALAVNIAPASGYKFVSATIKHGYNLSGTRLNKYGTVQYETVEITSSDLTDGVYTLAAENVDGDISIDAKFEADGTPEPQPEPEPDYDSYYSINYGKDALITRSDRSTNSVTFTTPTDGEQSFETSQSSSKLLFFDQTDKYFKAKAGETLAVTSGFNGSWMHSYLYIDFGNDGEFAYTVNDDGTPADGSDVLSYSYCNGKNSEGAAKEDDCGVKLPAATIPADVATGFYRVRYKVDWDDLDAGGSKVQSPLNTGGIIFDTRVNIHADEVSVSTSGENGNVTDAAGATLDGTKAAFGSELAINIAPVYGFEFVSATIRHGYNLNGTRLNKYGTVQYETEEITAADLVNGVYTLAAEKVDGDVAIDCVFTAADGINALTEGNSLTFRGESGKLVLDSSKPALVNVTDTAGRTFFNSTLSGSHSITLPAGVYMVNGQKVLVK